MQSLPCDEMAGLAVIAIRHPRICLILTTNGSATRKARYSFDIVMLFLLSSGSGEVNHKRTCMRTLTGMFSALLVAAILALSPGAALAADDEGTISHIDREALTITLDNGNTYKLSGEFDVEALEEGADVVLAYDTVAGEKLVTDLVIYE